MRQDENRSRDRHARRGLLVGCAWLAIAGVQAPARCDAEVLQTWSHSAAFGDASGAVPMGDTLMFVNTNEDEVLRLYSRHPSGTCTAPIYSLNVRSNLAPTGSDLTADLESCVKVVDANGTRIYWLGSMGNSTNGNLRPNRSRIFATQVNGNGTGSPPYTLTYLGRYDRLRDDIIAWDVNNLHGLGANYFGLAASTAAGVGPKLVNGFNVEGLTMAPNGTTAYLGCRTPFVDGTGPTTATSNRTHALIIPLLNMPALVTANPTPGPGLAQFGAPIVLRLFTRGIRSIDCTIPGLYVISAGPADNVTNPPVPPYDFRLFTWSGSPLDMPVERAAAFDPTYSPEGCIVPSGSLDGSTVVQLINDDGGNTCWRSMNCSIGAALTALDVPRPQVPGGSLFSRPPAPNPTRSGVSFAITVPQDVAVDISVEDLQGRRAATLWHGVLPAGEHDFSWNLAARGKASQPPGRYWVRLRSGNVTEVKSFTLIR